MGALITVADLQVQDGEPKVEDLVLAGALGFADRHMIRTLIKRHLEALQQFGEVSVMRRKPGAKGGRPSQVFYLNRKQALYITAKSDTAQSAMVTVEMVEVFDDYLRGEKKPVKVRAHRRARPEPTPEPAGFLEPGSDILRDMLLAVKVARVRVQDGHARDPLEAIQSVLEDYAARNRGEAPSAPLGDYNCKRIKGYSNVRLDKARAVSGARLS